MRRSVTFAFVLALFVLTSCRSGLDLTKSSTQLEVGVRAARANLWREALFRFQRAVQIDPANAMAQNNLAVAYEGIGEFEKARGAYGEALKLDRSNQYIQKNYSRFVEFYSKNRKREKQLAIKEGATESTASTTQAAATPPVDDEPSTPAVPIESGAPPERAPVPVANPDPPQIPVTAPPDTGKADKPPFGGTN